MTPIHLAAKGAKDTACGISFACEGTLAFTEHRLAVTCPACKTTQKFAHTIQRFPTIPGPYRG